MQRPRLPAGRHDLFILNLQNIFMRLRTFESFWLIKNGLLYSYPSLQKNINTQIAVVGAGITGALISHALLEEGYEVLLIDKRDIGQGSSSATTSMLQYEIDVPLVKLARLIGEDPAAACYRAGIEAINHLDQLISNNHIDCGFQIKKSLYLSHSKKAASDLHKEFEIRNKHHLGVAWLNKEQVEATYEMKSFGAILSDYKLAHELIHLNVKRGMQVYDHTEIKQFRLNLHRPEIEIAGGCKVTCDRVIFCTGFEATAMLKEKVADLFFTYACVSETGIQLPPALEDCLVWDTDEPYTYMRCTDDGRLLVGGEDASNKFPFLQQKIKERKQAKLVKKLLKILPTVNFIPDFSWGGTFGTTKDGLPYIVKSPEYENALFVLGFGGNGITFSVRAMTIIVNMMQGIEHPLAPYYRFGR